MKKGNAGVVVLIIALFVTIIALCGVVLYYNLEDNNSNVEQNNNENTEINNEQSNNNNTNNEQQTDNNNGNTNTSRKTYSYSIDTNIGEFIISKIGEVYFIGGERYTVNLSNSQGTYGNYSVDGIVGAFKGYKLNVSKIKAVYCVYMGQSKSDRTAILLDYNGNISELVIQENENILNCTLTKNVSGYSNIVSVVPNNTFDGNSAILIDATGKCYNYYGSNNSINVNNKGYMMTAGVGKIVIDNSGEVYYIPGTNWKKENTPNWGEINLNILSTSDIISGNYKATSYDYPQDDEDIFKGYKINVSNVQSAYSVTYGNGHANESIILVHKNGNISELIFDMNDNTNKIDVTLVKNVSGYSNIVSVVPNNTFGGNSAILIGIDGNQFEYFGIK